MSTIYYIGLDIHKKVIAYCIKRIDGKPSSARHCCRGTQSAEEVVE